VLLADFDMDKILQASDYISAYGQDMKIIIWNDAVAHKYKVSREDALGASLLHVFPDIQNDFRVKCFHEARGEGKSFYFSMLPYVYESGFYTQVIIPVYHQGEVMALSVVRHHINEERFLKNDLLAPLLKKHPATGI